MDSSDEISNTVYIETTKILTHQELILNNTITEIYMNKTPFTERKLNALIGWLFFFIFISIYHQM